MKTYISILRGINVSGQKLIKMDALRKLYENMGFQEVRTYVQSGNVVFEGEELELGSLEQKIVQQIKNEFDFEVPVIVLTIDCLKEAIDNNPFLSDPTKEHSFLHLTFLASKPDVYDKEAIESKKQGAEALIFSDKVIYLYCPNGYGKTKLTNNFLEARLKVRATTRNWKTVNVLLKISQQ
jgi:uncharacterized protein (DUF1697 family)